MPEFISILRWIRDIVYPQLLETNEKVKIVADNIEEVKALNTSIEDGVLPFERIVITVDTINKLLELSPSNGDAVIVKADGLNYIYESSKWVCKEWKTVYSIEELEGLDISIYSKAKLIIDGRYGDFIYDAVQSAINNGGTIFNGWVRQYSGAVNVKWFGAIGDEITDDTEALQEAIDSVIDGEVYVPEGTYLLSTTLEVRDAVYIKGAGHGGEGTNVSGYVTPTTRFKWDSLSAEVMVKIKSSTNNAAIFRTRFEGILLDGSETASTGILASSISNSDIDVACYGVIVEAIRVDDGNGQQSNFNNINLYHVYGVSTTTEGANGLVIVANTNQSGYVSQGCSQNEIDVTAVLKNGYAVLLSGCDNNLIKHVGGGRAFGGTGKAVWIKDGAWVNLFTYVTGGVLTDTGCHGNRILHITSEGGGITLQGDGTVYYSASDYVTGEIWETQKYPMAKSIPIPIGSFIPATVTGCDFADIAGIWTALKFTSGLDANCKATFTIGSNITKGSIVGIRLWYTKINNTSSSITSFHVRLLAQKEGYLIATPATDETFLDTAQDGALSISYIDYTFTTPTQIVENSVVLLQLYRNGNNASDTIGSDLYLLGAEIKYESDGPTNITSGKFDIPPY